MAEKDTLFKGKVKQQGLWGFNDLYSFTYDWLNGEGYKVKEKTYSEKVSGDAKDIDIEWEASKKVSDYFKFTIKMAWKILGMKSVEVQRENKKVKMNSGIVEIKFSAVLIKDYESKWEDAPLWKFLRGVYDKYIIKSRIDDYEDKLLNELNELIAQTKAFLEIEGKK
ncbi:MAG: hypothetical protein WC438_05190 [Candidatus Pacearchaeota archaeon]